MQSRLTMYRRPAHFLLLALLLLAGAPLRADEPDEKYLDILTSIEATDEMPTNGPVAPVLAKYREIELALFNLQKNYPSWNAKMIGYRLHYVGDKMAPLAERAKLELVAAKKAAEAPPAPKAPPVQVKLIDPGAEPRVALRLHPKAGDKQNLNMLLKVSTDIRMGEMPLPGAKMPRTTLGMLFTVKDVSPGGDILCDIVTTDASADGDESSGSADLSSLMAGFKGISGTATLTSRGISKASDLRLPAGASPQVRQLIGSISDSFGFLPLPEEAVGVGAKWEVKQQRHSQGLTIDETTVVELTSLDEDRLTVKTTLTQLAADKNFTLPNVPQGTKVNLDKFTGTGSGTLKLDIARPLPIEGNGDMHSEVSLSVSSAGQTQPMTMKLDVGMRLQGE